MNEEAFKRLVLELEELEEKINKLSTSFENGLLNKVSPNQMQLLTLQYSAMAQYSAILGFRIDKIKGGK